MCLVNITHFGVIRYSNKYHTTSFFCYNCNKSGYRATQLIMKNDVKKIHRMMYTALFRIISYPFRIGQSTLAD